MTDFTELQMLRDSAATYTAKEKDLASYRERLGGAPGLDEDNLKRIAELGWMGVLIPEEYDGIGLGVPEVSAVVRELGGALLAEPLVAYAVLGTQALVASTNEKIKSELLPKMATGKYLLSLVFQDARGEVASNKAGPALANGHVSGTCRFVAGASKSNGFLVAARSSDGQHLVLIEPGAQGLTLDQEVAHDGSFMGILTFDNTPVAGVACGPDAAGAAIQQALDLACIVSSAEMLGVMCTVLDMTFEYMRTRVQYGVPIGSFQALQHKAVDLYILKEICEGVLNEALFSLPEDPRERGILASRTKSRCSDAVMRITRECIQLHGAIGFTKEYDLGLYVHRAMRLSAWLGNGTAHRQRIQRLEALASD